MMRVLAATALLATIAGEPPPEHGGWLPLEPGLEFAEFAAPQASEVGDSRIRILRIDPAHFTFHLLNASVDGEERTARGWCEAHDMVAAINASMFQEDRRRSVSLMRTRDHVNNPRVSKDKSVLAFDALTDSVPPVRLLDRECDDLDAEGGRYGTLVQSIRMVSCEGRNVWVQQPRRWSTAAIGTDHRGRVLFIHCRSPYSTHDLIAMLQGLPIEMDRCMYTEGGPESQLFLRSGETRLEFVGSFESGFFLSDAKDRAWPVPNVVAAARRPDPGPR